MNKTKNNIESVQGTETIVIAKGTTVIIGNDQFTATKANKDNTRLQLKPTTGRLIWVTISDYDTVVEDGNNVFIPKTPVKSDRANKFNASIEMAKKAGAASMGEYITMLLQDKANKDLGPTALAKKYSLPNPIYVSKLRKKLNA